ncbi:receptor-like protein kinase FERONIA [Arachis stenosperma]|uniref:receptor-like protein kinase FERONIA n=1 Tax=Arachis stenosperma TaxID=217475 RepID=UPI0025ABD16B|nr:receptor-like protein kinase FERONIA [Arachis stenosperma]
MERNIHRVKWSMHIFVTIFNLLQLLVFTLADRGTYVPSENIVINCGSSASEVTEYDGRNWTGDASTTKSSQIAEAPGIPVSVPRVPYKTARIFRSQFTYTFNVTPGPKFVRLHFYPASYLGMDVSKAFLSVTAGNFTLLHNLSVPLNTDYFHVAYLMKEFIIHVSGSTLEITFSPSSNATAAFAFVNGIEVVSMPFSLYFRCLNAPLPLVGHYPALYYICNDTAMETLYRLNVGGDQITPKYDTGTMFRTWEEDDPYIFGGDKGIEPFNMSMPISYANGVPPYAAPKDVYRTSRSMETFKAGLINLNFNMTWFFPVDSGFKYLVRLHFCEIYSQITKVNEVVFSIYLNNQTADASFDPISVSGGPGVGVYQDYVVMVSRASEAKQDLWLDLHPNKYSKPLYYNSYLNGVEIFKLSSTDEKNLSALNPSPLDSNLRSGVKASHAIVKNSKKLTFILIVCGTAAVVILVLLCLILCKINMPRRIISWFDRFSIKTNNVKEVNKIPFGAHIPLQEIKAATGNFDEALIIGIGGFGKVYKGSFDGGDTYVAVKRGDSLSEQGALEYKTEIEFLSKLRHHNLVSLLGYCNEDEEMILVYNFMASGTLHDHLHLRQRDHTPLSWIQRLDICIGVAKGLHYLHTGTQQRIIHRDIKTTNILLDHNWVAKISDFGLSKSSYPSFSTTNVKGSSGYLDPEYYKFHKLTEKSDLYSLGVVLLEVLSARPAVSQGDVDNNNDEPLMLAEFAKLCFENGNLEQIVDPKIEGEIVKECFEVYLGVAMKCLAERGVERPSTGDVLQNLELAKRLQRNGGVTRERNTQRNSNHALQGNSDLTPGIEFSDLIMPVGR